ncbi:hypothetical protein MRQ86_03465 [Streptomyces sp. MMS21 TC-5]|uniref:hypothetical protein n=1 Tax=Streptomyces TaxID=1883 RepID=UPI000998451F|nr:MULTISPECIES: hypothetical protein [Streptomyces]MCI4079415.1 hypothetical protein [Streptomyces sp. MMS21 TC-5]
MIEIQPVLEIRAPDGFALWPVAGAEPYGFLRLSGALSPAEVGTAVMSIAACNDCEPDDGLPPRPADPLGAFLHGLLTLDDLLACAERDLTDFTHLVGPWAARHVPGRAAATTAAVARALAVRQGDA